MSDTYTINSGTITLTGTASWANNAVSASWAPPSNTGIIFPGTNTVAFTSVGQTNWTVPADVTSVRAVVVGGGAGGPRGSAGGYSEGILTVTPGQIIVVIVGAAGTTALSSFAGSSSFATINATGGQQNGSTGYGFGGNICNVSGSSGDNTRIAAPGNTMFGGMFQNILLDPSNNNINYGWGNPNTANGGQGAVTIFY